MTRRAAAPRPRAGSRWRCPRLEHLARLLAHRLERVEHHAGVVALQLGVDEARLDAGHAYAAIGASCRSASEKPRHTPLGHVVDTVADAGEAAGDGGEVDDVAVRLSRSNGSAAGVQYRRPSRLTFSIVRHSSVSVLSTGPSSITPALLTRMSRPAELARRRPHEPARLAFVGDIDLERDRGPALGPMRAAIASMRSPRRAPSATAAPLGASVSAVASPIPEEAPVIAALRPSSAPGTEGTLLTTPSGAAGEQYLDPDRPQVDGGDQHPAERPGGCSADQVPDKGGSADRQRNRDNVEASQRTG